MLKGVKRVFVGISDEFIKMVVACGMSSKLFGLSLMLCAASSTCVLMSLLVKV